MALSQLPLCHMHSGRSPAREQPTACGCPQPYPIQTNTAWTLPSEPSPAKQMGNSRAASLSLHHPSARHPWQPPAFLLGPQAPWAPVAAVRYEPPIAPFPVTTKRNPGTQLGPLTVS